MTWTMTIMHAPGMTINSQLSQMTESSLKEYSPTTAPFEDPIEKIHSLPSKHHNGRFCHNRQDLEIFFTEQYFLKLILNSQYNYKKSLEIRVK